MSTADRFGHNPGGRKIHEYCRKEHLHPCALHLAWKQGLICEACAEFHEYWRLKCDTLVNEKKPWCQEHLPPTGIRAIRDEYKNRLREGLGVAEVQALLMEYFSREQEEWFDFLRWDEGTQQRFAQAAKRVTTNNAALRLIDNLALGRV